MNEKFMGVGLTNAIAIALFAMLVSIVLKVLVQMYHIDGISEVILTA